MLMQLRNEREPEFIVEGTGLENYEGRSVRVTIDAAAVDTTTVVSDGAFSVELTNLEAWDTSGPLALLYIDADGNGVCTPEADVPISQNLSWNGDFDEPIYHLLITTPFNTSEWVCDSINDN